LRNVQRVTATRVRCHAAYANHPRRSANALYVPEPPAGASHSRVHWRYRQRERHQPPRLIRDNAAAANARLRKLNHKTIPRNVPRRMFAKLNDVHVHREQRGSSGGRPWEEPQPGQASFTRPRHAAA